MNSIVFGCLKDRAGVPGPLNLHRSYRLHGFDLKASPLLNQRTDNRSFTHSNLL